MILPRHFSHSMSKLCSVGLFIAIFLIPITTLAQTASDGVGADAELLRRAEAARTYGADTLLPTVHEFADPTCGSCRGFHVMRKDSLITLLTGRANFVYRFTPIPRLMRGYHGAKAALCAGGVGDRAGFETMLNSLFDGQANWRVLRDPYPAFEEYAQEAKLPLNAFQDCYIRDAVAPLIMVDLRLGGQFGASGTPTFAFIPPGRGATVEELFYGNEPMRRFEEVLSRLPSSLGNSR